VDDVDERESTQDVGVPLPPPSACGTDSPLVYQPHLWKESGWICPHSIHKNGKVINKSIYWKIHDSLAHIWGVSTTGLWARLAYFSTGRATYPQKEASYPQIGCLDNT